eukprot:3986681-Pleurochrysis_carterae.AAC.1
MRRERARTPTCASIERATRIVNTDTRGLTHADWWVERDQARNGHPHNGRYRRRNIDTDR